MPITPKGRNCPGCKRHYVGKRGRCDRCEAGYRLVPTSEGPVELLLPSGVDALRAHVIIPAVRLAPDASAADFVALLLKIVVERAADHVPERHRTWLAAQLHSLLTSRSGAGPSETVPLSRRPLAELGHSVYSWVQESVSHFDELPLLPFFRAETARFVRAHYEGAWPATRSGLTSYTVQGVVPRLPGGAGFDFLDDARFKSSFTKRFGGVEVRGKVPPRGRLEVKYRGQVWGPGETFDQVVTRCQLSAGWDAFEWFAVEEDEPELDFFHGFAGHGTVTGERDVAGKVPFAWFTHQKVRVASDPERPYDWKWEWAPLPAWLRASPPVTSPARRRTPR